MSVNEPVPSFKSHKVNPVERWPITACYATAGKTPFMTGSAALKREGYKPSWSKPDGAEKPPISPLSQDQARAKIEQTLQTNQPPDQPPSRWCLRRLLSACGDFVALKTLRGLLGILRRLKITRQRARGYVHSPDPLYQQKLGAIQEVLQNCDNQQRVVVFTDQLTYYNQPSVAPDYALEKHQPKACQALGMTKAFRIQAALNPVDGRVTALQRSKITVGNLVSFYQQLQQAYPCAQTIYVVLDNWPVHYHPDVLAALEPQQTPFPLNTPPSWGKVKARYKTLNLPIQLVPLPTYASWLNPIERLWKYLKKELIHNHVFAAQSELLKARLEAMLGSFSLGSKALLSYCGLLNPKGIYAQALKVSSAVN